ncbi:hypothetical protein BX616_010591 [Lobosporangium transversale]|nr:hypothetical protein BX616_010591 [Lobosporangium transversale]
MLTTSFLQLHTAMYEWNKECPQDLKRDLDVFFGSKEFLDRPDVFYKGMEDSSQKWVALISMTGLEETRAMLSRVLEYDFTQLHEARNGTFSKISAAPRMPLAAAYNKFLKDLVRDNKALKRQHKITGWTRELDRATEMIMLGPKNDATTTTTTTATSQREDPTKVKPRLLTPLEYAAAQHGMWFISVDIESFEFDHSKILEIGWSIHDSRLNKMFDKHYAISEYRHLKNGKYVADRRDRFIFGQTIWASLQDAIAVFQEDLTKATKRNPEGVFALIAHDMSSDEGYLRKMGVIFPEKMVKFDTLHLNGARAKDATMTGLGRLLDELDIENYSLQNAGNDAHYTMELFLWLVRNHEAQKVAAAQENLPN